MERVCVEVVSPYEKAEISGTGRWVGASLDVGLGAFQKLVWVKEFPL